MVQDVEAGPTAQEKLDTWRAEGLQKRGFDEHDVELLVAAHADLHDVDRLLDTGCPHSTALLILL